MKEKMIFFRKISNDYKLKKNQYKITQKESTGITLIALVVTVIVLLILAGVSVSMLTGENRYNHKSTRSIISCRNVSNRRTSSNEENAI